MKPGMKSVTNIVLYTLTCFLVISTAFVTGYLARTIQAPVAAQTVSFSVFWEVWDLVNAHFYGDASDNTARTYGAIEGSLIPLQDPYTVFVEPREREREQEELRGSFGGIGAWVEQRTDGRIVLTPMEGRPAEKAGILAGDELVAVDGKTITDDMSLDQVVSMVKGEAGKIVTLTIRRQGRDDLLIFNVRREEIVTESVVWRPLEQDATIGYIQLKMFNERTNDELEQAIKALRELGAETFIVDLRDNGGGLLSSAVDVTSQFLSDGIVLYDSKGNGEETSYPVRDRGLAYDDPIAILVNGNTASASEIVAGAIQDRERGKLIGTQTFGKASVQLLFDLSDGSSLHVTNAHWLTPNRRDINGLGLTPDIIVNIADQDRQNGQDPQLQAAVIELQGYH